MTKHIQNLTAIGTSEMPGQTQFWTFADAIAEVRGWHDLSPQRRRDLGSMLLTVTRMTGIAPGDMALSPAALREHLPSQSAITYGVTDARMKNTFSGVRFVMRRLGLIEADDGPISAAWLAALGLVKGREADGFRSFARFCSARQLRPDDVLACHFEGYEAHRTKNAITPNVGKLVANLRGRWNRVCRTTPDWPGQCVGKPREANQYILPLAEFSEAFRADLVVFGAAMAAASDAFDDSQDVDHVDETGAAVARRCRPAGATTVELRKSHARWAASALVASGTPIAAVTSVADLVTPVTRAKAAIQFLWEHAGKRPSAGGMHIAEVLYIIAKYHARLPAADIARIKNWDRKVRLTYSGMTAKNRLQIQQMLDPDRERMLLEIPHALMMTARTVREESPHKACTLAMRAVAIQILTRLPLRLGNLIGLRLDQHLQRTGLRNTRITHFSIAPEFTKNRRPIFAPVSVETAAFLQEWIDVFRPLVPGSNSAFLFPSHICDDRSITPQSMRDAVKSTMDHHVGVKVSPQRFRHWAAHVYLRENPGNYETVRQLLGNASVATIRRSYAGADSDWAFQKLDEMNNARREKLRQENDGKPLVVGPRKRSTH